ncbi:hypothetical protein HMPREF0647_08710 [Prevotella bivia DNF00320]|uniref:GLPGLI family protein n=1 Tax=Prevotella bivia DNF00320 TaxID=1401068 RepID=A0A096ABG8_9BACT|nr:GLPGLI family protein [Prevotella bivia]KGF43876.1 hypothetical protein HMPREF0647_08710 [Prevotella bivia DNF00320]
MIKSYSLILAFIMSCFINMHSQTVNGAMPSLTLVNKTTFDSAKVQIFYEFSYLQDSTDIAKRINGQTMLTIGKQICGFCDYFSWKNDSINDAYYEQGRSSIEYFAAAMSLEKPTYNYPLVKDISKKEATIQIEGLGTYQYTQTLPVINWEVIGDDSIINNINVTKAKCCFGGRDWTAWFAMDYPVPYGPYLFDGLPGLIVSIRDSKNNFSFRLNGIINVSEGMPIYLHKNIKIIKTSREKARQAYRNEKEDPLRAIKMNMPGVIIPPETAKTIKQKPYNPIELE